MQVILRLNPITNLLTTLTLSLMHVLFELVPLQSSVPSEV